MTAEKLGSLIGASFGLVFVLVNTGSVPTPLAWLLRVLAVIAFLRVVCAVRRPGPTGGTSAGAGFSRGYWLVVAAEVVAIWGGIVLLNGPLNKPDASVAWVSSVVGAHFVALAVVWSNPLFHWLGAALFGCGAAGLVLAGLGSATVAVDLVGGVLPGAILLGSGLWGSSTNRASPSTNRATR